jgi:hypothetical protein
MQEIRVKLVLTPDFTNCSESRGERKSFLIERIQAREEGKSTIPNTKTDKQVRETGRCFTTIATLVGMSIQGIKSSCENKISIVHCEIIDLRKIIRDPNGRLECEYRYDFDARITRLLARFLVTHVTFQYVWIRFTGLVVMALFVLPLSFSSFPLTIDH